MRISITINIKNYENIKVESSDLTYENCIDELILTLSSMKSLFPEIEDKLKLLLKLRDKLLINSKYGKFAEKNNENESLGFKWNK